MSFTSNEYEEYTVRLHSKRDLDLLTLCMNDKKFKRKVVKLLSDYANGVIPRYPLEGVNINDDKAVKNGEIVYKSKFLQIFVNKKLYPEVVELLSSVRKYYRCDFIKCIVKNSLPMPIAYLYFTDYKAIELKHVTEAKDISVTNDSPKTTNKAKKPEKADKLKKVSETTIKKKESITDETEEVSRNETSNDTYESNDNNYTDILDMLIENY